MLRNSLTNTAEKDPEIFGAGISSEVRFSQLVHNLSKEKQEFSLLSKHFLIIFPSVCDGTGVLLLRRLQARGEARLRLAEDTGRSRSTESS